MVLYRFAFMIVAALLGMAAGPAVAQPKGPPPTLDKGGWIDDPKLQKAAPPSMAIVSDKALKDLYKAWKLGEPPAVDFTKEIVVVITSKGDDVFFLTERGGSVLVELNGPPKEKAGFAYHLMSRPKEGVKSVNNKPLPKS